MCAAFIDIFPEGMMAMAEVDQSKPWPSRMAAYRHGIKPHATIPQVLANQWTEVMVEACRGFHEESFVMQPAIDYIDDLTDEMVEKRIAGYQVGYDKEYDRRAVRGLWSDMTPDAEGKPEEKLRYVFADLPMSIRRAVVSRWDEIHAEWMKAHPAVHYHPDIGYFWLIDNCVVKMFEEVDAGIAPTEERCVMWESLNAPGGLQGWMALQASRGAGDMEPIYTAYGDFED